MSVTGYVALSTRQVMCDEFSQCYDDVNICLWISGSELTQSAAQTACQQRNSFLPRITNSSIQFKLAEFRTAATSRNLLENVGFWIDVKSTSIDNFHWIDGAGRFLFMHNSLKWHSSSKTWPENPDPKNLIWWYRSCSYRCLSNSDIIH